MREPRRDDEYHPLPKYVEHLEHLSLPSKYGNIDIDKLWFTSSDAIDNIMNNKSICMLCEHFNPKRDPNSPSFKCNKQPILTEFDYVTGRRDIDEYIKCRERNSNGDCEMFILSDNLIKHKEYTHPSISPVKRSAWKRFLRMMGIGD